MHTDKTDSHFPPSTTTFGSIVGYFYYYFYCLLLLLFLYCSSALDHVLEIKLSRLVRGSNQRPGRDVLEPHLLAEGFEPLELGWCDVVNYC